MWQVIVKEHFRKYWKYYAVALLIIGNIVFANTALALHKNLGEANNVIQAKVDEIQEFDSKLGLAESDLRRQEDLIKKYKDELKDMDEEVKDLVDKYDLKLKERDSSIAYWKGKVKGGTSTTTITQPTTTPTTEGEFETVVEVDVKEICGGKTIGYSWKDDDERFHLKDPDISESGDEEFEYKQYVSLKGYVFADETGQIQVKKVEVKEVIPKENEEGDVVYMPVPGQNVSLVESKFEYINKIEDTRNWYDIFGIRLLAMYGTQLYPGIGVEVVNLGRWIDWANVGLYGKLAVNPFDGLMGLQESTVGVGVSYHLIPPLLDTNIALGVSVNTPFNDLGHMILSVDAIFYLNNW